MRRRLTYIRPHDAAFNPNQVSVTADSFSIRHVNAAREDRTTFDPDHLSPEVAPNAHNLLDTH